MSEIEINEDNCVLSEIDFILLRQCFDDYINASYAVKKSATEQTWKLLLKIEKLNDLAKQAKEKSK